MMVNKKTRIIAATGPESTGKSRLAEELAKHYGCAWVPEVARGFLNSLDRDYTYNDILFIAQKQHQAIKKAAKRSEGKYLFCDTELTVTRIWCEYKYGRCHPWIVEHQEAQAVDLYLLMKPDLPWQPDPLREHPDSREELFGLYERILEKQQKQFAVISGVGQDRLNRAIHILERSF